MRSTDVEPRTQVLVVDDDAEFADALGRKLTYIGYAVEIATDPVEIAERLRAQRGDWEVVLLDVGLPGLSGIELLRQFRDSGSEAAVIMLTGDASAATATTCLRTGAFHYLTKPCLPIELASIVESAARHAVLRRRLARGAAPRPGALLIGESPAVRRLQAAVDKLASNDVAVLIQGESGTGKELVARALHAGGPRDRPFLAINCSAIPDTLIDSELFGHARGAYTGATANRPGVFVEADGGSLFLDEIGDMPLHVQARLLRVLQEGEVRPVGSAEVKKVEVRVIAATHVDLRAAVDAGRFREDLFYRLNVVALRVPPLRERRDDIPLLAAHFLRKHCAAAAPTLTSEALDLLAADPWPGNVRELENALLHAIAFRHGDAIGVESLPAQIRTRERSDGTAEAPQGDPTHLLPLSQAKRQVNATFERGYLMKVLERARGSVSEAARLAGIDRTNLRRLLKRYEIQSDVYRANRR
ncbi:MAG TPA: sigma-54 dependent transcriptional regulator [Kofleriaceae bacterium]|nr:sigma-54 dependent transcriptional regulator [Kofleriaceae bacterium]